MSTTPNRTVRAHLRQLADGERERTIRFVVWARVFIITLYTLSTLYYVLFTDNAESRATIAIFIAYTIFAVAVAFGVRTLPSLIRYAGMSFALLDIPAMVGAVWTAVPYVVGTREYLLADVVPYLCAAIVVSVLTLDLPAIVLATVSAELGVAVVLIRLSAPAVEYFDPMFGVFSVGFASALVVWRLRSLVEESRRKDFAGKYVLGDRIGAGGMAEVFEATYSPEGGFERRVAVKRVLPSWANDPDFIALFRREAEVGARLAHPNLVQVLDYGKHLESYFIAMEFIEGVSLSGVLRALNERQEHLPLHAAYFIVAEVAEAMTYLQERPSPDGLSVGLVHRDLNPPNVLLSKTGEVKVSDFGVARWADSKGLTQTGAVRGKVASMAPEHLQGSPPSTLGDQFSLGALAFEVLTGRKLFTGASEAELVRNVLEAPLIAPSTLRPGIPPEVDAVVLGLLERDPARRIHSARVVTQVLGSLTGRDAPYPRGRESLVALLQAFSFGPGPVPPSPSRSDAFAETKPSLQNPP